MLLDKLIYSYFTIAIQDCSEIYTYILLCKADEKTGQKSAEPVPINNQLDSLQDLSVGILYLPSFHLFSNYNKIFFFSRVLVQWVGQGLKVKFLPKVQQEGSVHQTSTYLKRQAQRSQPQTKMAKRMFRL